MGIIKGILNSGKPQGAASHSRRMDIIRQDPFAAVDNPALWDSPTDPLREYYRKEREKWRRENKNKVDEEKRREEEEAARVEASFVAASKHEFDWPRDHHGVKYHVNPDTSIAAVCRAKVKSSCPFYEGGYHFMVSTEQFDFLRRNMGLSLAECDKFLGEVFLEQKKGVHDKTEEFYVPNFNTIRAGIDNNLLGPDDPHVVKLGKVISLNGLPNVNIARRIGNTRELPWKDHAYWELYTEKGGIRADRLDDEIVKDFIKDHVLIHRNFSLNPLGAEEVTEELTYQIKNIAQYAETKAKSGGAGPAHYTVVDLDFSADATIDGRINYKTSGFNENFLLHPATSGGGTQSLAPGTEIFNEEFGDGAAGWSATKISDGTWRLEVTGTRGNVSSLTSSNIAELKDFFTQKSSAVALGDFNRSQKAQGISTTEPQRPVAISLQRKRQMDFLEKVITADTEASARLRSQNAEAKHSDVYGPSDSKTMDSIFKLYE